MVSKFRRGIETILAWQVKRLIKRHNPKIVAVTGSVGKTSTKSAIAHVLSSEYSVLAHDGNYNSAVGLPLAIFEEETPSWLLNPVSWIIIFVRNELRIWGNSTHDAWVLEMGAERKGEIANFLTYIKPDIGVVTAVKGVHMEEGQFTSVEEILAEKWQVAKVSRQAVINAEDKLLKEKVTELRHATTYGLEHGDSHWSDLVTTPAGLKGTLIVGKKKLKIQTGLIGKHSLYAATAAAAVADLLAVDPENIAKAIGGLQPVSGRMNPLPGRHGSLILDDSYNSSPDTALAALETLYQLPKSGRKIAILGSMNELGSSSTKGHEAVGKAAANVDLLITIGNQAKQFLAPAAHMAGLKNDHIRSFDDPYKAGEFVLANLKKGDQVLVKGSQNGVFSEEAAKLLLARRDDRGKLVRQSSDWLRRKQRAFGVK